jgi:ureidoacrylate peracid hydrolase
MHSTQLPPHIIDRIVFRRGRLHGFEHVDAAKTALIVVDMQNVFCAEGAAVEVPVAREIVPNINRLACATRVAGGAVVWIQMTVAKREEWALVLDNLLTPAVAERVLEGIKPGSEGHALWPAMEALPNDIYIAKNRYSAFLPSSSPLTQQLHSRGIDTVMVVGTLTNVCCESSARDAAMQDFKTFMISDANAARSDEEHTTSLINFIQTFGDVRSTDEMIFMLENGVQKAARRA